MQEFSVLNLLFKATLVHILLKASCLAIILLTVEVVLKLLHLFVDFVNPGLDYFWRLPTVLLLSLANGVG